MGNITIKDVARAAGVGIATVSRVLNDKRHVSPSVRQRVHQAIRELGYEPDHVARNLRTRRSYTVLFLVSDISNVAFSSIAQGVHRSLESNGYHMILSEVDGESVGKSMKYMVESHRVDGVIAAVSVQWTGQLHDILSDRSIPLVLIDRDLDDPSVRKVYTDYYSGFRTATEYLLDLGHRHIGLITGDSALRPASESMRGYGDALRLNGHDLNLEFMRSGSFSEEFARQVVTEFVGPIRTGEMTALIAGSNPTLMGVIDSLQKFSVCVPEDLSLIAFEDSDFARLMTPSITVLRRPLHEIGRQAAELVINAINDESWDRQSDLVFPVDLVKRASTREKSSQ